MAGPSSLRPVAGAAAVNAAAQGLAGVILCVVALCVCFCAFGPAPRAKIEENDFAHYITYYLQQDECREHTVALYPSTLTNAIALRIWIALGLFFSASMMVSSVVLFIAVAKGWSDEKLQIALVSWLFINLFTAFDDVILCYVFATDFDLALNWANQVDNVGPLALALVAILAARGMYLWILNIGSIVYLFFQARALHKYINEQIKIRVIDQHPIESWPTLDDDFEQSKESIIERSMPAAFNPTPRMENGHVNASGYPEHSAMARWPAMGSGGPPREQRPREERPRGERRRSKTVQDPGLRRQAGVDNPGYEAENRYYFRLQSEIGSTRDYEESSGRRSDSRQHRTSSEPGLEQYRPRPDPWNPGPGYVDEHGVPIPPVDYLDDQSNSKTLTLQEAILDKSLRLKKVPEELRKGFYKY